MRSHLRSVAIALAAVCAAPPPAQAQDRPGPASSVNAPSIDPSSPFLGGVPKGAVTPGALALSLKDAIGRGLENNLGVLLQEEGLESARGSRWQSLSGLLPDVSARVGEARRKSSLAEFGFTSFPGITSRTIGPFNVFDTRLSLTQNVFDLAAINEARAGSATVRAANFEVANARDLVVLVVANLYLETVTAASRVETARAALTTAQTLNDLANDLKRAGIAAGIDTLRAQVQVQTERERLIIAENQLAKARLTLARAIGLPPAQDVSLTDRMPDAPIPGVTLDAALAQAYSSRGDYLAAEAQVQAAEATARAARAGFLPTLQVTGEVGRVGTMASSTDFVYAIAGFCGGAGVPAGTPAGAPRPGRRRARPPPRARRRPARPD